MARLILFLLLFAALALAVASAATLVRALALRPAAPQAQEPPMPASVRAVSFAVLWLLLVGLASGWLGPG